MYTLTSTKGDETKTLTIEELKEGFPEYTDNEAIRHLMNIATDDLKGGYNISVTHNS